MHRIYSTLGKYSMILMKYMTELCAKCLGYTNPRHK